jgi:hypothetical protein
MDKITKMIYQDVLNNRNLEENLPRFLNSLADNYNTMALVRLALHDYTLYEAYCDEGDQWGEAALTALDILNRCIGENILESRSGEDHEKAIRQVDTLRNDIMNRMKLLTSYADAFQIQEYILNRVEYRFKEANNRLEDEEFAREILQFIFDTQDNVIINDKIREVIGQLPVRITKQRYFDLIKDSLRGYLGASRDTLDSYLYMLRTSSLLEQTEGMDTLYPKLWEQKELLSKKDYKNITSDGYEEATRALKQASRFLESEISVYYSLQEIVNEVYAILLCLPYTGMSAGTGDRALKAAAAGAAARAILKGIHSLFHENRKQEPEAELLKHFDALEGIQEELNYDLTAMEEALYQADQQHRKLVEGIMADKLLNVLLLSRDLLSNSLFIDFYEIKSKAPVSEEMLKEEADRLFRELTKLFEESDRMISRAVMANTLNKLPVFFDNHKEVMDYVLYSLEKCSDPAEKAACIEIISDIISA